MNKLVLILIALSSVCGIAQTESVAGNKQKPNILLICIDDLRPDNLNPAFS